MNTHPPFCRGGGSLGCRRDHLHIDTHTQTHTNIYIHTYIIGGQIFERSMIFLNTHLPLCRGGGGVPHIPLMQNCPMIFLNTHHPPSGSGHLCDLHKASLASSGTTRAAHVLTKAAAGTSYQAAVYMTAQGHWEASASYAPADPPAASHRTQGHNTCAPRVSALSASKEATDSITSASDSSPRQHQVTFI